MALDMAKYRALFLEEGTEHLAETSRALLELEKDAASIESIDLAFRMAHSIKSMAASVGYEGIAELAHALEDRMEQVRAAGRVTGADGLGALFAGLEELEHLFAAVRDGEEPPPPDPALIARLKAPQAADASGGSAAGEAPEKKAPA